MSKPRIGWVVSFKLRPHDERFFSKDEVKDEIVSWLEDLGFDVKDIRID